MNFIALAQAQGGSPASTWMNLIPFVLIMVIFYFLLIRPQQKKEKERKQMINQLQKNDKVVTVGGIHGVIMNVKEGEDIVVIKSADTKLEMSRSSIQNKIVPKKEEDKATAKVK